MINLLADAPSTAARFGYIASIPWVTQLQVPPGDRYTPDHGRCEAGVHAHKRCSYPARWMVDDQGLYCWTHLFTEGLFPGGAQTKRTKTWMTAHPPEWRRVRS